MNQERDQHRKNQPMYRRQIFRMPGARTGKALTPSPWGRTQGPGGQSTRGRWGRTWGGTPRTWRRPPGPAPGPESQHCPRTLLRDLWNLKRSSWGSVEVWGVKWSHTVLNRENNIYFAYVGKGILYKNHFCLKITKATGRSRNINPFYYPHVNLLKIINDLGITLLKKTQKRNLWKMQKHNLLFRCQQK